MNIDYIEQLTIEFRKALECVANKRLYGMLSLFACFPRECCTYTSDLLATYLIENGISIERIQSVSGITKKEEYTHCWLMIDEYFYIDITADQFNKRSYFKKYEPIPSCVITQKGCGLYECFDLKSIKYFRNVGINSYSGDIPFKLKVVYDAAIQQIHNNNKEK